MNELRPPKPIEEMSDEEGREFLKEAVAHVEKQGAKAKQQCALDLKVATDRLKHAETELARVDELRRGLAAHADHPELEPHAINAELLHRMYTAMKAMMEIQAKCAQANMAALENITDPVHAEFKAMLPQESLDYLEQAARFDFFMGTFLWHESLAGVDALLRVAVNERAIDAESEAAEAHWAQAAEELRASMQGDREVAMMVQQLGTGLQETQLLLTWAQQTLQNLKNLPPAARRGLLEDPDWSKLNGKVMFLGAIGEKVKDHPLLSKLLPVSEISGLPYPAVPSGGPSTGRLGPSRSNATGRLGQAPGSGRLPG